MQTKSRAGFSIIEILIAIIVLAIGIMGVLGALTFGLRAGEHSDRMTQATALNRKILEMALAFGAWKGDGTLQNSELTPVPINTNPYNDAFVGMSTEELERYERQVEYDPVELVNGGSTWEGQKMARITVTVLYRDRRGNIKRVRTFAYDRK
ncbi:MAG: prepilin-type N-terminal cleavage/methylation domain-containing protein [Candidatus Eremiobacterota bacterium]